MLALLLFACNPWTEVLEREKAWYDADRIESELGIDLVEISAGEPIGYLPRLVVRPDRIEMDNRAWFLNLPDRFFLAEDLDHETRLDWLIEPRVVLSLEEELESFAQIRRYQWKWFKEHSGSSGQESPSAIFYPNMFSLIAEPEVPWKTVFEVIYSAGLATFEPSLLVGRVGNRLRTPMAGRGLDQTEVSCVMQAVQQVDLHGVWMELRGLPPLVSASGCQASTWESSLQSLESVLDHCTPRWQAELAELGFEPGETNEWACADLFLSVAPEVAFETVLTGMAKNYQAYPRIVQSLPGLDREDERCEEGVHISALEKTQLDAYCDLARVADRMESWGDPRVEFGLSLELEDMPPSEGAGLESLESQPFQGLGAGSEEVTP